MICGECHGTVVLGKCSNCGWIDEAFVEPEPVPELDAAEVAARERRRIGYHVRYRNVPAVTAPGWDEQPAEFKRITIPPPNKDFPVEVITLFGVHPLVWAAEGFEISKGHLRTEVLDWREFDDVDGLIYDAVTKQFGFSWAEAEPLTEDKDAED